MRSVLILDLDGTVLSVNSFRLWASYMLRAASPHMAPGRRLGLALRAGGALVARKAGLLGHEALKHHLQSLWQRSVAGDGGATLAHFNNGLRRHVRPELQPLLSAVAAGRLDGVLATAAAADYAQEFGGLLGIPHVLATPAIRPRTMPSNIGPHKRDAVLDFLARQGWMERPRILFTDHEDDLPLIEICGTIHWFGPATALPALAARFPHAALHQGFTDQEDRRERC
ncbi:hypothetical protein IP70_14155 [alpha proteobacterium AAP38]|uniref:haloacid dehalogenase-like hydrolase n=1 Tax=Niveispirillum sp. TaxID=1917217 RepID=UPI0006B9777C|nr:hypothetical protein IP70_14155 [alpha proteobacterium AAP38]